MTVASMGHTSDNHGTIEPIRLLAHQGGWDEALLVGLPLALIGLLLWVANRRVSAQLAAAAGSDDNTATSSVNDRTAGSGTDGPSSNDGTDAR